MTQPSPPASAEAPQPAPFDDGASRRLRRLWFDFLAVVGPLRPDLYRYCRRLTGNAWSAEDLAQETLLRAYAVIGRGDLHDTASRVSNLKAYLLRIASNLWIDQARRASRAERFAASQVPPAAAPAEAETRILVRDAAEALYALAPQERAALVLRTVFEFDAAEIAAVLSTTEGAVKSALHRARGRLEPDPVTGEPPVPRGAPASPALIAAFVAAFNDRDLAALTALLLEHVDIEVQGVGGERGRQATWVANSLAAPRARAEAIEIDRTPCVAHFIDRPDGRTLASLSRLEEADGQVARIQSYPFSRDLLGEVAARLGVGVLDRPYHQDDAVLATMVAGTVAPWGG